MFEILHNLEMSVFLPLHSIGSLVGYWVLGWESFSFRFLKHCSVVFSGSLLLRVWWRADRLDFELIFISPALLGLFFVSLLYWIFRMTCLVADLFVHCTGHSVYFSPGNELCPWFFPLYGLSFSFLKHILVICVCVCVSRLIWSYPFFCFFLFYLL